MPDLPDWSQSVSIDAASVTIPVSGTVSITSGTVTIANASIAVINATGTKITSARPPKFWAFASDHPNPNTTITAALDPDVQALVFHSYTPIASLVHLRVAWHGSPDNTNEFPLELYKFTQNIYAIPILPSGRDGSGNQTNVLAITLQGLVDNDSAFEVWEIFESSPLWMELFPLPQLEPNQVPGAILKTLAANVGQWLITPVANVQISLFEIIELYTTNFSAQDVIAVGHASVLPASQAAATGLLIEMGPMGAAAFVYPYHGAQLPRGDGIYVINLLSAAGNFGCAINYSLS